MSSKKWKLVKLQETVSKLGDGLHGTPKYDEKGEYYFINGSNLVDGKIVIKESTQRVSRIEFDKYKKELNNRTILLGINGTIGNVALYDNEKCILGKSACYFNVINSVDKHFIKYVVLDKSFQTYIQNFASGTTIKNVSLKLIREYEFNLPPKETQQRIASILSSLDDKIELNRQTNQTLEGIAQTLFQEMCVPKGEELPEGWRKCIISNLFEVKDGTHDSPKQKLEGKYLITSKHLLKDGTIDFNSAYKISAEDFNEINKRSKVDNFDILYSMIGTIGNTLLVNENKVDFSIKNMGLFKTSQKQNLACFIYLFLKSEFAIQYMKERYSGSTQQYVTLKTLREIPINSPNQKTITEFNKIAVPVFEQIKNNIQETQTLIALRDSLLPKLMKGEIEIQS